MRIITRQDVTDTVNLRYEYGEDGNRVASLVAVGSDTTKWTVTHRWVYDGTSIVADSGTDHSWQWHAFQGLNRLAEIADKGALRVRYVVTDHQGSTQLLLTDTASVLGKWVWDPWGNLEYARTDATTDLLYQGKTLEPKLGEWYFNARWYSPERGSFTGRDPKLQFYSPYNYVGNGPLVGLDPDGKERPTMPNWDFRAAFAWAYSTGTGYAPTVQGTKLLARKTAVNAAKKATPVLEKATPVLGTTGSVLCSTGAGCTVGGPMIIGSWITGGLTVTGKVVIMFDNPSYENKVDFGVEAASLVVSPFLRARVVQPQLKNTIMNGTLLGTSVGLMVSPSVAQGAARMGASAAKNLPHWADISTTILSEYMEYKAGSILTSSGDK